MTAVDEILSGYDPQIDWLTHPEQRDTFIGASEAAAALGLDPYKDRYTLWLQKTGQALPDEENAFMRYGRRAEPFVRQWFAEEHPHLIVVDSEGRTWRHPDAPFIAATPDGFVKPGRLCDDAPLIGLELKTADVRLADRWDDDAPLPYVIQAYVQMMCTGVRTVTLACDLRPDLHTYDVEWEQGLADFIYEGLTLFWGHVVDGTPPPPTGDPGEQSGMAMVWDADTDKVADLSPTGARAVSELVGVQAQLEELNRQASTLKAVIQYEMGDAREAHIDGRKVAIYYDTTELDLAALTAERPDVVEECSVPTFDLDIAKTKHKHLVTKKYRAKKGRSFRLADGAADVIS